MSSSFTAGSISRLLRTSNVSTRSIRTSRYPVNIKKILASNRGEIAIRIMRAGTELGLNTVGIFSYEDRFTQHRYKADQAFLVGKGKTPVGAYLDIPSIIEVAKNNAVDAIHPGYGFLSENEHFAAACAEAGITFVGPTVENLKMFGDKTSARNLAMKVGVRVVPGTHEAVKTIEEAREFVDEIGYPVIIKASMGGGGRGMRVVTTPEELEPSFIRCSSEALASFGDGSVFIERYVDRPRHIEVQILGDGTGNVVHLYDRDCSVQRRHQKVIETAPALDLSEHTRKSILEDAKKLTSAIKYKNAGTVEFLVDQQGNYYFIEVNPRIQVEHTVTEEITGIDLVQSQILIADGATLDDLHLAQPNIRVNGYAMQCRVTTEDPAKNFSPDTGIIEVFRTPGGMGIRLDDGPGFPGAYISPHYDSLLLKLSAKAANREEAAKKLRRALTEMRVRGVSTNKSFLLNVLSSSEFLDNVVNTGFIAQNPHLLAPRKSSNRGQKLLRYIGNVIVNGPDSELGAKGKPLDVKPLIPQLAQPAYDARDYSLKKIYDEQGPAAFAKAVRQRKEVLITDTTWRDAHQSLLATRLRTVDMLNIAEATKIALRKAYSLECWGGATFDVSMRFLRECPWDRLVKLREAIPNIPFQMLLRGANAVGYTSYPDNVVFKFCEQAQKHGMDIFRIFDSLNYIENMRLGIDAVGAANGIIEAAICYTGDICNPMDNRYNLDYYLDLVRQLVQLGIHVLAIKDMAGLLKPEAAKLLVSAIRKEWPDLPIHVHTHDTAGTGVASMLAAAKAGADAVDCAMDALSGTTSQPSLGAVVCALQNTELDTGLDMNEITAINDYWEETRGLYAPFESGQKSGSADVYEHEMPGGQYTNLLFQSQQLGLTGQWPAIKRAYAAANRLLGDIIKVTPSSKVVGDLAQFMVQNNLSEQQVIERAESLSFPQSVVEYFQGYLGIPPYGFPEPLRSKVVKGKKLPNGKECFEGRPGAELPPYDFEAEKQKLASVYGKENIKDVDVLSHAQYPAVFKQFMKSLEDYGDLSLLDTHTFVGGMKEGDEISVEIEHGKILFIKLHTKGVLESDGYRDMIFELNGQQRTIRILDKSSGASKTARLKADISDIGSVGAPMPGVVIDIKVKVGDEVQKGVPLLVLSAMKMETVVAAPTSGRIAAIHVKANEGTKAGDLLVEIK